MKLCDRIYELRRKAGYSQDELAVRCGVSRQSVSKWESGSSYPEIDKIMQLAEIFDVSTDYLLGRKEETKTVMTMEIPSKQEFEYRSKWHVFGLPLVHIHLRYHRFGYGVRMGFSKCQAKGVIAIGNRAVGLFAIGLCSYGLCSIGFLSIGLLSLGILSLGLFAMGTVAFGVVSLGIISIGIYAFGVAVLAGKLGVGVAVATLNDGIGVAISAQGNGYIDNNSNGRECLVALSHSLPYEEWLKQAELPEFFRALLHYFTSC